MKKYNIATLPGDGVGVEVIAESIKVLTALQQHVGGYELDFQHYDVGVVQYLKAGEVISDNVFNECQKSDAIYLGALGTPNAGMDMVVDKNGTEVTGHAMFKIRFGLDLFAGVRPIQLWPGVPSALAGHDKIDFIILRENTEGLFASYGGGTILKDSVATDTQVITREGSEKLFNFAFKLAQDRTGRLGEGRLSDGKKAVTCAHKGNVFRTFAFFKKIFGEVAQKYQDQVIEDYAIVDALALWMLQNPENYDIIVMENMHGDILSDMAAAFVGGMGMAPSGDIGLNHAMFQPSHGTAPTIAGKGIVNPCATILSGKMMLEWLGQRNGDQAMLAAAKLLEESIYNTFTAGIRTADIKGNSSTAQFGDEIINQMKKLKV
ncbi:MAG: 3-isopropylmalate dehydrogenase [Sporomusa sp.]|jgi:3-isopropylmalate dehydrogenase|nr:3-isopropylmalate dehydrogenase [Sporomusa sp.]